MKTQYSRQPPYIFYAAIFILIMSSLAKTNGLQLTIAVDSSLVQFIVHVLLCKWGSFLIQFYLSLGQAAGRERERTEEAWCLLQRAAGSTGRKGRPSFPWKEEFSVPFWLCFAVKQDDFSTEIKITTVARGFVCWGFFWLTATVSALKLPGWRLSCWGYCFLKRVLTFAVRYHLSQ